MFSFDFVSHCQVEVAGPVPISDLTIVMFLHRISPFTANLFSENTNVVFCVFFAFPKPQSENILRHVTVTNSRGLSLSVPSQTHPPLPSSPWDLVTIKRSHSGTWSDVYRKKRQTVTPELVLEDFARNESLLPSWRHKNVIWLTLTSSSSGKAREEEEEEEKFTL